MRIGIDASWASAIGTGTASYTNGLVQALVREHSNEYVLYFRPGDDAMNPLFSLNSGHVRRRVIAGWGQPGRTLASLARAAASDRLDVFHSPGYFLPLWKGPKVVTFHDVNMFLEWDKWWRPGMRLSWLSLCGQTILASRLAARILTDSHAACTGIKRILHVENHRLTVVYPGVDDIYFDPARWAETKEIRDQHELDGYLLSVGVLSPQKNLESLLRAFCVAAPASMNLAIVGREDGAYCRSVLLPLIEALGMRRRVKMLGVVAADLLPGLYAHSQAFIFPSFAEGFGLPPLEAMACGTPVVASSSSSLPEVLGESALYVDPLRVDSIAKGIADVTTDELLRLRLITTGGKHVQRFRWSRAAQQAFEIYDEVA